MPSHGGLQLCVNSSTQVHFRGSLVDNTICWQEEKQSVVFGLSVRVYDKQTPLQSVQKRSHTPIGHKNGIFKYDIMASFLFYGTKPPSPRMWINDCYHDGEGYFEYT